MIEKIRNKLEKHVEALLKKPIITNEEFTLLSTYLSKLEFEAGEEERKESWKKNDEKFKAMMGAIIGGD